VGVEVEGKRVRGGESRRFTANDDDDTDIAKRFLDWCMEMADKRYTHADIQAKRNRTVVMRSSPANANGPYHPYPLLLQL
jgi:hypothetical protein